MNWQPHQIVYLQADQVRLFAEVIQIIPDRQMLWLRPLALAKPLPQDAASAWAGVTATSLTRQHPWDAVDLYDLRQGSDLLWPMTWVQPALDVDVIPLLARLGPESPKLEPPTAVAHQHLCHFIQQLHHQQRDRSEPDHQQYEAG